MALSFPILAGFFLDVDIMVAAATCSTVSDGFLELAAHASAGLLRGE